MKKALIAAAAFGAMAVGMIAAQPVPSASQQTEARPTPAPSQQPISTNKVQPVIREQRSVGDAVRAMRIPAAHKNRAGGERAHRRWRKTKSSGRR